MWIFVALFGILGVLQLIYPRAGWWIANFWKVKPGAEPSGFSLWMYRILGLIYVILAVSIYSWIQS